MTAFQLLLNCWMTTFWKKMKNNSTEINISCNLCFPIPFESWHLWSKRYLPMSREWWTLTANDEFYFPPLRLLYQIRYWKEPRGYKHCLIHLVNPRDAHMTSNSCFKASFFSKFYEAIHKHLNQSLVTVVRWKCFKYSWQPFSTAGTQEEIINRNRYSKVSSHLLKRPKSGFVLYWP